MEQNDRVATFFMGNYMVQVAFEEKQRFFDSPTIPGQKVKSGGFIIQVADDEFIVMGTEITVTFMGLPGAREEVRIRRKEKGCWKDGTWQTERILNGDDVNLHTLLRIPEMQRFRLYRLPNRV